jgi:hypothetical protein
MSFTQMDYQDGADMLDRIVRAVTGVHVDTGAQWIALSKKVPGVIYFATDVDPRSFDYHEAQDIWLGRAELLLKAVGEIRPGQFEEVSFTLPVRVELIESGAELLVKAFDYCVLDEGEEL